MSIKNRNFSVLLTVISAGVKIPLGVDSMTKLILVRHGESEANFSRIYTGQSDIPLTERGHSQAVAAAKYIKKHENVSKVYASPLRRAFDTGKHIADECSVDIVAHRGLMEIFAGDWEGKFFDDIEKEYRNTYSIWRNDIGHAVPDNGESVLSLSKRCIEAVMEIVRENPDSTVVLATHATPIRALTTYWSGISAENMRLIPWSSNASLTMVCYDEDKGFHSLDADIRDHLAGIETELPSNV